MNDDTRHALLKGTENVLELVAHSLQKHATDSITRLYLVGVIRYIAGEWQSVDARVGELLDIMADDLDDVRKDPASAGLLIGSALHLEIRVARLVQAVAA